MFPALTSIGSKFVSGWAGICSATAGFEALGLTVAAALTAILLVLGVEVFAVFYCFLLLSAIYVVVFEKSLSTAIPRLQSSA